jgi:sarcosine oxidase, subunit delta
MKLLNCPLNGPRNITEFSYGGELRRMPHPSRCEWNEWVEYVVFNDNEAGVVTEWWCHNATSYWFLVERNTITDEIIRTFAASELFNRRVEFVSGKDAERE